MRPSDRATAAVLLALLAATAPGASAPAAEARRVPLTIAFTGDVSGYLEPCG